MGGGELWCADRRHWSPPPPPPPILPPALLDPPASQHYKPVHHHHRTWKGVAFQVPVLCIYLAIDFQRSGITIFGPVNTCIVDGGGGGGGVKNVSVLYAQLCLVRGLISLFRVDGFRTSPHPLPFQAPPPPPRPEAPEPILWMKWKNRFTSLPIINYTNWPAADLIVPTHVDKRSKQRKRVFKLELRTVQTHGTWSLLSPKTARRRMCFVVHCNGTRTVRGLV